MALSRRFKPTTQRVPREPAMNNNQSDLQPRDLLIVALSFYVLLALLAEAILPISTEVHALLEAGDTAACIVFLSDFFYRLWKAPNKLQFMRWGWIDFVTSIPTVDALRWGRLIRVLRLLRVFRASRGAYAIVRTYERHRSETAVAGAFLTFFFTIMLSSIAILTAETGPGSNITTGADALWWSISTITTVGYGDKFPVTVEERLIAAVLMLVGVGLFGALTGLMASWFVKSPTSRNEETLARLENEVRSLRSEFAVYPNSRDTLG